MLLIFGTAFWDTFREWLIANESGSTTVRNLGLVAAGLIALPLALWRGHVAEQQASAAQQSLRNERYQKGAEMLGSEVLSVRMGGIYALQRLAKEHQKEYHVQIMGLFCAFVRNPTKEGLDETKQSSDINCNKTRKDVWEIIRAFGNRTEHEIKLERDSRFNLDLSGARLPNVAFVQMDLSNASFQNADLSNLLVIESKFQNTSFFDTDISAALFGGADDLVQSQIDQARSDLLEEPSFGNIKDARSGKPIVWRGGRGAPLKDSD